MQNTNKILNSVLRVKIKNYFIFLSVLVYFHSFSQNQNPRFYFGGINFNTGFIWAQSPRISYLSANSTQFQIKIYQNLRNTQQWQNPFNATRFGYSFTNIKTDNSNLGDVFGFNIFIEPEIYSYKRIHFYSHLGGGFAYSTKTYDRFNNNYNLLISYPFSFLFNIKINLDYMLSDKISFGMNFGLTHASNASLDLPNLGLNNVNYGINLGYKIFSKHTKSIDTTKANPHWEKNISVGYATRNSNEHINKYYHIFSTDFEIKRLLNSKNAISFGFDYVLRQGDTYDVNFDKTFYHYFGFSIGHELFIDKVSLISQVGIYTYDTRKNNHYTYAHLGVRYYLKPNLYTSLILANRKNIADFLQISVGYKLK